MEHSQSRRAQTDWWDKTWRDKRGRIVIFQWPNIWLIGWAILDVISIFTNGTISSVFWWLATTFLAVWAIFELHSGVNYFRRGLGAVVLLFVAMSIFQVGL